jgi:hypothetical protein
MVLVYRDVSVSVPDDPAMTVPAVTLCGADAARGLTAAFCGSLITLPHRLEAILQPTTIHDFTRSCVLRLVSKWSRAYVRTARPSL